MLGAIAGDIIGSSYEFGVASSRFSLQRGFANEITITDSIE